MTAHDPFRLQRSTFSTQSAQSEPPVPLLSTNGSRDISGELVIAGSGGPGSPNRKPTALLESAISGGRSAQTTAHQFIQMQGGLPNLVEGEVIGASGRFSSLSSHNRAPILIDRIFSVCFWIDGREQT